MNRAEFTAQQKITATPSGRIAYVEQGDGPAAVFLHGILLNKYFWRHQLAELPTVNCNKILMCKTGLNGLMQPIQN
jgi:hypothetical protein